MADEGSTTDLRLIDVAIRAFGRSGLDGVSTRDLAGQAGKPLSAITYHFGGKEGLYLAAARHIADQLAGWLGPALDASETMCGADGSAEDARAALHQLLAAVVEIMTRDETEPFARFIVREQAEPTEAFTILYDGVMGRALGRAADLLIRASSGSLGQEDARVRALMLLGQVLVFRVCRATTLRATGWSGIDAAERDMIRRNGAAMLEQILTGLAGETR